MEMKYYTVKVNRNQVEEFLIGLGLAVNEFLSTPLPQNPTLEDLCRSFPEGDHRFAGLGDLDRKVEFFLQNRVNYQHNFQGRLCISYDVDRTEEIGELRVMYLDNGENVPREIVEEIYGIMRAYAAEQDVQFIREEEK